MVYFCVPTRLSFLFFVRSKCSVQMLFSVNIQISNIVQSLSDYYPIIVQLLFCILILVMYSRYLDPENNKNISSARFAYFHLSIGFSKADCTIDISWYLQNQFLQNGVEEGETVPSFVCVYLTIHI
jgi:hypothetical protein